MGQLSEVWLLRKTSDEIISGLEPWQLRAARAAADLTAQQLADLSGLSVNSVRRVEQGGWSKMSRVNQRALIDALEATGAVFLAPQEGMGIMAFKAVEG